MRYIKNYVANFIEIFIFKSIMSYIADFVIIFGIFFGVGDRAKGCITVDTPGAWTALEYPRQVVTTYLPQRNNI